MDLGREELLPECIPATDTGGSREGTRGIETEVPGSKVLLSREGDGALGEAAVHAIEEHERRMEAGQSIDEEEAVLLRHQAAGGEMNPLLGPPGGLRPGIHHSGACRPACCPPRECFLVLFSYFVRFLMLSIGLDRCGLFRSATATATATDSYLQIWTITIGILIMIPYLSLIHI